MHISSPIKTKRIILLNELKNKYNAMKSQSKTKSVITIFRISSAMQTKNKESKIYLKFKNTHLTKFVQYHRELSQFTT